MTETIATRVIQYWFADIGNGFDIEQQNRLWYGSTPDVDEQIRNLFGECVDLALSEQLEHWKQTDEGALALVILLDQFTRNIFRGDAKAFSGDSFARKIVRKGLMDKIDSRLTFIQRSFFYMPLEHSESLPDQNLCVECFERLLDQVPEKGKKAIESNLRFAIHHRDIIEQFGRFPHRNRALRRVSTPEEEDFLDGGGARFGQ